MFVNTNESRHAPIVQDSKGIATTEQHADAAPKITAEYFSNAYQKGFHSTVRFLLSRGVSPEAALDTAQAAWTKVGSGANSFVSLTSFLPGPTPSLLTSIDPYSGANHKPSHWEN